jgi:predicted ester cyclase
MFMNLLADAFSDQRWTIDQVIAEGDLVAIHCIHSGRHTGDFFGLPANRAAICLQADAHDQNAERQGCRALGGSRRRRADASADQHTRIQPPLDSPWS